MLLSIHNIYQYVMQYILLKIRKDIIEIIEINAKACCECSFMLWLQHFLHFRAAISASTRVDVTLCTSLA